MITVIIPMAGKGSRFMNAGITTPKPLVEVDGLTLIEHSVGSLGIEDALFIFVTRPFDDPKDTKKLFDVINSLDVEKRIAHVQGEHHGTAHSALYAKPIIIENKLLDSPLIVTNVDQKLVWDASKFLDFINENDPDGAVVLYKSENPKNSFAKVVDKKIVEIIEKSPISKDALIGVHYWKKASDFIKSADQLSKLLFGSGREVYVSETYNSLIKEGKTILPYWLGKNEKFIPLGTPEDVEEYNSEH